MVVLGVAGATTMACKGNGSSATHDASPIDASRATDASSIDASPGIDASPAIDASPIDAVAYDASLPCDDDLFEDNDIASMAAVLPYSGSTSPAPEELYVHGSQRVFLCSADEDWFHLTTSFGQQTTLLKLRVLAAGAGLCGASCDEYVPPAGPESTVTVEVYNAATMALLGEATSDVGRVWMSISGSQVSQDVLVRIHGPPEATYQYRLIFLLTTSDYEDECEC